MSTCGARALLGPLSLHKPITLSTMVATDSPSIDVKVAGIEFGGVATLTEPSGSQKADS